MVRVTVVNDNSELLDVLGEILASERYATTLIRSAGSDVVQQVCRSRPDLVLVDLRHGGDALAGWDIVRELRSAEGSHGVPILLSSADYAALSQLEPDLDAAGPIVTLKVPFGLDDLMASIHRLTDQQGSSGCS